MSLLICHIKWYFIKFYGGGWLKVVMIMEIGIDIGLKQIDERENILLFIKI